MVLRLKMPWRERLAVLGMFMTGATVCAVSAARIAVLVQLSNRPLEEYNDMTYYTSPAVYWTNIELAIAIVSACLPTLRPIFRRMKKGTGVVLVSSQLVVAKGNGGGGIYSYRSSSVSHSQKGEGWAEMEMDGLYDGNELSCAALTPLPTARLSSVDAASMKHWPVLVTVEEQV